MAQHDYVIANGTGAAVRSDLNNGLAAIVSQNSGATAPATTYAYMTWADTTAGVMKMRNGANNAWITLYQLDGEWSTIAFENGTAAAPSIYFKDSGTDTGIYSPGADQVAITTGGTQRLNADTAAITSTLPVVHPLGAVGTPSITFAGDLNTGVFSPGADTLALVTAGSNRLHITSAGLVGIGTSAPTYMLSIKGNSATSQNLLLTWDTNQTNAYARIRSQFAEGNTSCASEIRFHQRLADNDGGYQTFWTTNAAGTLGERLRIDPSGNVGIGTTSPGYLLTVSGGATSLAANQYLRFGAGLFASGDGSATNYLFTGSSGLAIRNAADTSEFARIDSSGRLLVGTSSTSATLTALLQGNSSSATSNAGLLLARGEAPAVDGTVLGALDYSANNHVLAARILCKRDGGTWTAGTSQPTRLEFSTTADGAAGPTERLRLASNGRATFDLNNAGFYLLGLGSAAGTNALRWSSSTGLVTADTSSRLVKENIVDCPYGIDTVKALQPRKYFRTDDQRNEIGFVADEMTLIIPELVPYGPKSVITNNPDDTENIPIGVNYEKLTAVLTKALQEAVGRIETLEAEVTALKA